jgi:hypothetical protein
VISHRPADERDLHFIADSWVGSWRDSNTTGCIQVEDWYPVMIPQVAKMRARPDVRTLIAYETGDAERIADIYGFIVADTEERPALVYYVFVKEGYRRAGIARGLFAAAGIDPAGPFDFVCSTPIVAQLRRKLLLARWRPLHGRFPKAERRRGRSA